MPSKKDYIKKLQEIYKRKHGVDISDQLALDYFENLIALTQAIYQTIKK